MTVINLYRYEREDGGINVSPNLPEEGIEYTLTYRIIADEGKVVKKGEIEAPCIDTDDTTGWEEIDAPVEEDIIEEV